MSIQRIKIVNFKTRQNLSVLGLLCAIFLITHWSGTAAAENLPIINIDIPGSSLYGSTGILDNPTQSGKAWEREASFEITNSTGRETLAASLVGLRVHGGASRQRGAKKSLKIYFKSQYGSPRLDYDLFGRKTTRAKKVILRAGFNDSWNYDRDRGVNGQKQLATYIKDQVARDIHESMGQNVSRGVFVKVYLNGNYHGIFNAVEAIDEDNLESDNVSEKDITIMSSGELKNGHQQDWNDLVTAINFNTQQTQEYFENVSKHLDLDNFASYLVLNFWLQNYDWPHQNWKAVKLGQAGRWTFYMWDAEYSFGSGNLGFRTDLNAINMAKEKDGILGDMIKKLLSNPQFNRLMKTTYAKYRTLFTGDFINSRFELYADQLKNLVDFEGDLLNIKLGRKVWNRALAKAISFKTARTKVFDRQIESLNSFGGATTDNTILCESHNFEKSYCSADSQIKRVIEINQISRSNCRRNREWGIENGQIWVDNGCRAYFKVSL